MGVALELAGQRFGYMTVLQRGHSFKRTSWICKCDCGNVAEFTTDYITHKDGLSCGCMRLKKASGKNRKPIEYGSGAYENGKKTRLYRIWNHMRERCGHIKGADERHLNDYRDRGIRVCDEWLESFGAFKEWALDNGYSDDLSIDRIDNDGNYEPSNCRWATRKQQDENKRRRGRLPMARLGA